MASIKISDQRPVSSELLLDSQSLQALTDEEAKKIVGGFKVTHYYHNGRLEKSTDDGVNDGRVEHKYTYS